MFSTSLFNAARPKLRFSGERGGTELNTGSLECWSECYLPKLLTWLCFNVLGRVLGVNDLDAYATGKGTHDAVWF